VHVVDFVALDVETANANMASICQIGLATYSQSSVEREWMSYVDPDGFFDPINVSIHGINEDVVKDAPKFSEVAEKLYFFLDGQVVVSHTHFDRLAIYQAAKRYGLEAPKATWLDSARVARRAWADFAKKGYGLKSVCDKLGYSFRHHDALEDAKASGQIILAAINETGLQIDDWFKRVQKPIDLEAALAKRERTRDGNPEGPLYGEVVVFTGALDIPRREAADLAAEAGCRVASSISKKVTILVVGDQDISKLAGHDKSSKHRKTEELIRIGLPIRIIGESDFQRMVDIVM
jgi:DNA polymerase-3 subunit epsilon